MLEMIKPLRADLTHRWNIGEKFYQEIEQLAATGAQFESAVAEVDAMISQFNRLAATAEEKEVMAQVQTARAETSKRLEGICDELDALQNKARAWEKAQRKHFSGLDEMVKQAESYLKITMLDDRDLSSMTPTQIIDTVYPPGLGN